MDKANERISTLAEYFDIINFFYLTLNYYDIKMILY